MNTIELVHALLLEYESSEKYSNLALSSHLLDGISPDERGRVAAIFYTTVERKLKYDYFISSLSKRQTERIDSYTLNALRLGCCLILDMGSYKDHAATNETVKLGRNKGERGFINALLRSLIRARDTRSLPLPDRSKSAERYLSVAYSFPKKTVKKFVSLFGEKEAESLLSYYNSKGYTDLTVNTTRICRSAFIEALSEQGISANPSPYTSIGVRINGSVDPRTLAGFDEGWFFVQDAACAVSAQVLAPEEGDRIVDVCACPGGKSFAAAIVSSGKASITAFDVHESKLSLITSSAERLGLAVSAEVQDATHPRAELFDSFDRVICDVPCSGLGVLGKKSDMRYKDVESEELQTLQYSILEGSAKYLKAGGVMVYSTCTILPEENELIVEKFLASHEGFVLEDFTVGSLSSEGGMLTILPHRHFMDGFFIAKIRKAL